MRVVLVLLLLVGLHAPALGDQDAPKPGEQVLRRGMGFEYWLYLPSDYGQKPLPLVIFLHGIGLKHANEVKINAPPARVDAGEKFPFVLVSPFWKSKWWSSEELIALIDAVAVEHKVDRKRIYVTGLSMGGFATWDLACRYPDRFAAIVPICGGGKPDQAAKMKDVPVWAFHGALDKTVKPEESERIVEALRKIGARPKLTIFPNAGHVCWPEVYRDPAMYEWMLSHRRTTDANVDELAAQRYDLQQGLTVRPSPILVRTPSVGRPTTQLKIANTSQTQAVVRGKWKADGVAVAPADFAVELAPGESKTIETTIDGGDQRADDATPIELSYTVEAPVPGHAPLAFNRKASLPISPILKCPRVITPITIDGDLSDWAGEGIELRSFIAKSNNPQQREAAGKQRARLYVAYADDAVYAAVRVEDDDISVTDGKPVWEQDGAELRFDFRSAQAFEEAREASFVDWKDVVPVLISPAGAPAKETVWKPESLPAGAAYACRPVEGGYVAEVRIPWPDMKNGGDPTLRQFRLNVTINDRDGQGRTSQFWWHRDWREMNWNDGLGTFQAE